MDAGPDGFTASLDQGRMAELKLDHLTVAERAALDAAIQAYFKGARVTVEREKSVREFGQKPPAPESIQPLQSRMAGPFLGWSGGTVFQLENGQVWQQVGSDQYYHPFPQGTEVTIFPVGLGGFRLRLPTGASVAVRRR